MYKFSAAPSSFYSFILSVVICKFVNINLTPTKKPEVMIIGYDK